MSQKNHLKVRIYYQDTDAYGIVYHANYLKFAERGRYELLRSLDPFFMKHLQALGVMLVARHVEVDYFGPARLDDELHLETWVGEMKKSSFVLHSDAYINDKLINSVKCVLVTVNEKAIPIRIPQELKDLLG